jgi:hypothetical protein
MSKTPRWICLEPKCGHVVSSKPTGGAWCLCSLWRGGDRYLLPDQIEIPRPSIDLGDVDLLSPDCQAIAELKRRRQR